MKNLKAPFSTKKKFEAYRFCFQALSFFLSNTSASSGVISKSIV